MNGMRMQRQEDGSEEGNGKTRREGVAVVVAVAGADAGACVEAGAGQIGQGVCFFNPSGAVRSNYYGTVGDLCGVALSL
jgi:hypothetical protein